MTSLDLYAYRATWNKRIDDTIAELLDELAKVPGCSTALMQVVKQAVLAGGKRLRPLICLAALRSTGGNEEQGLRPACSLELVHAYSLVHDDLPAMDDDDFRRGKPSCHKMFGEAMAILAGDALLTYAFEVLARHMSSDGLADAVVLLASRAGAAGMVGGQAEDVRSDLPGCDIEGVEYVHARKTGAMFEAAARLGGLIARSSKEKLQALSGYGQSLGLAYQIVDDILAWRGDEETLGRPTGSDQAKGRRTHPQVAGVDVSRKRVQQLVQQAIFSLEGFESQADVLRCLAELVDRRIG